MFVFTFCSTFSFYFGCSLVIFGERIFVEDTQLIQNYFTKGLLTAALCSCAMVFLAELLV